MSQSLSHDPKKDSSCKGSPGTPQFKKICCLLLNWDDGVQGKNAQVRPLQRINMMRMMKQVSDLEKVLRNKYGAFVRSATVEHEDFTYCEKIFWYEIENFIKENDSRSNLVIIFYSGCSYVHGDRLFLEPHRHTEPNVRWPASVDRYSLFTKSTMLWVFDTTSLREGHYDQFWKDMSAQLTTVDRWPKVLNILSVNGAETQKFIDSLSSMALSRPDGFTVAELCDEIKVRQDVAGSWPLASIYPHPDEMKSSIVLLPLARPKLSLFEHAIVADPHQEYLKEYTEIHKDGVCEVIKMRMGPDIQEFSVPSGMGISCVVAVKRFFIKGRRRLDIRKEFLDEREKLVAVSKRDHNHLLGMLASFETRCGTYDTLNVVLPFASGGNLYNFLRIERESRWEQSRYPISSPSLVGCLADWRYAVYREVIGLADALAELHIEKNGKYMMHCDIKPDNILIHNRTFKIADFGLSRFKDSDETSKTTWYLGTALYSPPEREELMGRGRDVWALGCVFLEIAFMIRYAFQDEPLFFNPDVTNAIDHFKFLREKSCEDKGREKTAIYHKTMECVHFYMTTFKAMRLGLRRVITLDGMMPIIRRMLDVDQARRITASDAARSLESHYLEMQRDPRFQRDIICRENPGGHANEWPEVENDLSGPHFNQSATHGDGPFHPPPKPPLSQERFPTSSDTTGATARLDDMGLNGQKRSSSAEERGSNKRPYNGLYNMHHRQ